MIMIKPDQVTRVYPVMVALMILIIVMISGSLADVRYRGNAIHPDYPGQCYYEELKQPIPKNQSYKPINRDNHCESIYCRPDYVLQMEYCGRHNLHPKGNCKIESDMRRSYPDCCPKIVCQESESNHI